MELLYIERWLKVPLQKASGEIIERTKCVPQGSAIGQLLANLFLHFERYADDALIHCSTITEARKVKEAIRTRPSSCGMELHAEKTYVVYCKDNNRRWPGVGKKSFDFLGYTFQPRMA